MSDIEKCIRYLFASIQAADDGLILKSEEFMMKALLKLIELERFDVSTIDMPEVVEFVTGYGDILKQYNIKF